MAEDLFDSDFDSSSEEEEARQDMLMLSLITKFLPIDKVPCRTSMLNGKDYILEVLVGNPTRCYESFRMRPHVFLNLSVKLKEKGTLKDSRKVSAEEGLAMGLSILCHGTKQRIVAERFQHSLGTIHTWFKKVLRALVALGSEIIRREDRGLIQPEILGNKKWYPYFEKCIGAIDGTHVAAWAPASKQRIFRGRKAEIVTQNVMAACSHDMMFTFMYSGWEGTANDSRVFLDAVSRPENNFPMPPQGHYYVVDASYPNIPGFLAPYRGERYHLNDFQGRGPLRGKCELFNYRHSSVRNVIERCFGVWKARFKILKCIPNYPLRRQKLIPLACAALHNFIRNEDKLDRLFNLYGEEGLTRENLQVDQEFIQVNMTAQQEMGEFREEIANKLWIDYNRRR